MNTPHHMTMQKDKRKLGCHQDGHVDYKHEWFNPQKISATLSYHRYQVLFIYTVDTRA